MQLILVNDHIKISNSKVLITVENQTAAKTHIFPSISPYKFLYKRKIHLAVRN